MMGETQSAISPFSVWTRQYENGLDEKYGIELGELQNKDNPLRHETHSTSELVRYDEYDDEAAREILNKYKNVPNFCAMQLESGEELFDHINTIYGLMYDHYVLGKEKSESFPTYQCSPSSQNLMEAGMLNGYPNASVVASDRHAYNAFPFLLDGEKGFIIADPTSDQLGDKPRNHIFVARHGGWEYETSWGQEKELYPIEYINLDSLRKDRRGWGKYIADVGTYFKETFENPIRIHSGGNIEVLQKREASQKSKARWISRILG